MKNLIITINLCVLLLLVGCAEEFKKDEPLKKKYDRPDWIDKPEPNFVGKCTTHVKGVIAQEQCAYKKALADITMLKQGSDIKVSGTIVDRWHDKTADVMYVLIKEN